MPFAEPIDPRVLSKPDAKGERDSEPQTGRKLSPSSKPQTRHGYILTPDPVGLNVIRGFTVSTNMERNKTKKALELKRQAGILEVELLNFTPG